MITRSEFETKLAAAKLAVEEKLRDAVGRHAFSVDTFVHRLPVTLPGKLGHNICLAADVTVGWGPSAADWPEQQTPFLRTFYRWFWQGRCPDCGGAGRLAWSETRQEDGSYLRVESPLCHGCSGSGIDRRSV